jgi:hypothetical protein
VREADQSDNLALIAGPTEFLDLRAAPSRPKVLKALKQAYLEMDYDQIVIGAHEKLVLDALTGGTPAEWMVMDGDVATQLVEAGDVTIAVVAIPALPRTQRGDPSDDLLARAGAAAQAAARGADLVMGMSLRDAKSEQAALAKGADGSGFGAFDIIYSAGHGPALPGKLMADSRTLWVRAYDEGKYLHRIDFPRKPGQAAGERWKLYENIVVEVVSLSGNYAEDENIAELLGDLPQ